MSVQGLIFRLLKMVASGQIKLDDPVYVHDYQGEYDELKGVDVDESSLKGMKKRGVSFDIY